METIIGVRAICFDCNGVISDDEPLHMRLFQEVLAQEGIVLTREEYFQKYLAMDDRDCFLSAFGDAGKPLDQDGLKELIARKAVLYKEKIKSEMRIFPGVLTLVKNSAAKKLPMVVVSGALREEIKMILKAAEIGDFFSAIIAAEDVLHGKPDPEGYQKGYAALKSLEWFEKQPLHPWDCLAIEDSVHGVYAAQRAGLRTLAITNSYSAHDLAHADYVISSLEEVTILPPPEPDID